MRVRLPLPKKKVATLISAYAPTMSNPDEVKDKFYEDLKEAIAAVPKTDKLIILGDFNARVGSDHASWEGVLGKHGIGKCNSNGLPLLETCAAHDLLITNTVFRLPNRNKTSWIPPFQALASTGLSHRQAKGQAGCQSDKDHVWCGMLDRPPTVDLQDEPPNHTTKEVTGHQNPEATECRQTQKSTDQSKL